MWARLLRLIRKRRPAPEPHLYPAEIERRLRELGLSPFAAEELQR